MPGEIAVKRCVLLPLRACPSVVRIREIECDVVLVVVESTSLPEHTCARSAYLRVNRRRVKSTRAATVDTPPSVTTRL